MDIQDVNTPHMVMENACIYAFGIQRVNKGAPLSLNHAVLS